MLQIKFCISYFLFLGLNEFKYLYLREKYTYFKISLVFLSPSQNQHFGCGVLSGVQGEVWPVPRKGLVDLGFLLRGLRAHAER